MRIAFITRSTLHSVPGGDSVQILQTAKYLRLLEADVDIKLSNEKIEYGQYDAFHFFNLIRPADILPHLKRISKPIFLTPILVDYDEYDRLHRKGLSGGILRMFSADGKEYVKAVGRGLRGQDSFPTLTYLLKGHKRSIRTILEKVNCVLPNSEGEHRAMVGMYGVERECVVIPNGIDPSVFGKVFLTQRTAAGQAVKRVLCVARFEGLKNQLNLIKALSDTEFNLTLIGKASPNQPGYYRECKRIASSNVKFIDHIPQEELVQHYLDADIHVLPSWFETCGLSSLEAAAMGCQVVITDKGYAREYFGDDAFYCEPGSPPSILDAVRKASLNLKPSTLNSSLPARIHEHYTWPESARLTFFAYQKFLP